MEENQTGIARAIEKAGGQVKMAEDLGCTQQNVSIWLQQGFVPTHRVVEIEQRYGVPRLELVNPKFADLIAGCEPKEGATQP